MRKRKRKRDGSNFADRLFIYLIVCLCLSHSPIHDSSGHTRDQAQYVCIVTTNRAIAQTHTICGIHSNPIKTYGNRLKHWFLPARLHTNEKIDIEMVRREENDTQKKLTYDILFSESKRSLSMCNAICNRETVCLSFKTIRCFRCYALHGKNHKHKRTHGHTHTLTDTLTLTRICRTIFHEIHRICVYWWWRIIHKNVE